MKHEILNSIFYTCFTISFIGFVWCCIGYLKTIKEVRQAKLEYLRSEEVYRFRMYWLHRDIQIYMQLPDYDSMVTDGKELKIESYINLPNNLL